VCLRNDQILVPKRPVEVGGHQPDHRTIIDRAAVGALPAWDAQSWPRIGIT
jgi:hypothetical protein